MKHHWKVVVHPNLLLVLALLAVVLLNLQSVSWVRAVDSMLPQNPPVSIAATVGSDTFSYPDGNLVGNGGWVNHSGSGSFIQVSSGEAVLQHGSGSREDAHLVLTGGPYTTGTLTAAFDLRVDGPSGPISGSDFEYFAHFMTEGSFNFRARTDVVTPSGAGDYTLGIASGSSTAEDTLAVDFSYGDTVAVVLTFDFDTGIASLSAGGDTAIGTEAYLGESLDSFALRQSTSSNNETIYIDNLVVTWPGGASEADVGINKTVDPGSAAPGATITYTLAFSNTGAGPATGVVITDTIPVSVTNTSVISSGVVITQRMGTRYAWDVADMASGASGIITITGQLSSTLPLGSFGNTAAITTTAADGNPNNNSSSAFLTVRQPAVTFLYDDLEDVVQPGETVYIAGEFNGWTPGDIALNADATHQTFSVTLALDAGNYGYKYIVNDGSDQWDWLNTNNRSVTVSGDATVDDYRNIAVGWANLNGPATMMVTAGQESPSVSGQLYIQNVTNPAGEGRGLRAELGYGTDADPATWTWTQVNYASQTGNNDVFAGTITPTVAGTYSYTLRYSGNWGSDGTDNPNQSWTYGDLDGVPFSPDQTGVMTVNPAPAPPVAVDDFYNGAINKPLIVSSVISGVLGNDSDPNGDPITAVLVQDVATGALALNPDGTFVYTPTLNFLGPVTFTYQATDTIYLSNVATVTITVTCPPNPMFAVKLCAFADGSDVSLNWLHNPGAAGGYEIHASPTPYFMPGPATITTTLPAGSETFAHVGVIGDGMNYYYLVVPLMCPSCTPPFSNPVGKFEFAIVPGN